MDEVEYFIRPMRVVAGRVGSSHVCGWREWISFEVKGGK